MKFLCYFGLHTYKLVSTNYSPPLSNLTKFRTPDPDAAERCVRGFTTFLYKCIYCDSYKNTYILGKIKE